MRIIAIEGIDGSGKTVQLELLRQSYEARGLCVETKAFPEYDTFTGREIGAMLCGSGDVSAAQLDPKSMALWFALNRYQSFSNYACKSDVLLVNRYVLSNAVYQSIRSQEDLYDWIMALEHVHLKLPKPDVYVCLDVAPSQASCNVDKKGFRGYVGERKDVDEEDESIQHRCRAKYLEYAKAHDDIEIIGCMDNERLLAAEEINERIVKHLTRRNLI